MNAPDQHRTADSEIPETADPVDAAGAETVAADRRTAVTDSTAPAGSADPADPWDASAQDAAKLEDAEDSEQRRTRLPLWLDTLVTMVVALVIAVLVKTFLIQPFYIPSASMNPTLLTDDKILVSKLSPGVFDLERGDVIVFEDPGDWIPGDATDNPTPRVRVLMALSLVGLAPDPSQDHLVKRLIGMPGDHVVCAEEGAQLEVNGVPVDEPYINPATSPCQVPFDVTVPAGKVWVMGDNRHASADSAWHEHHGENGFVDQADITGRAVTVFWPMDRWSGLRDGEDAFAEVPESP